MRNKISCSVTDCSYNNDTYCCKDNVSIGGAGAMQSSQTCCDSYVNGKSLGGFFTNMLTNNPKTDISNIQCNVESCKNNSACQCSLDSVSVSCNCDPKTCSSPDETYCDSYEKR